MDSGGQVLRYLKADGGSAGKRFEAINVTVA